MINLGDKSINRLMVGDTEVNKVYLGTTLVYEKSTGLPKGYISNGRVIFPELTTGMGLQRPTSDTQTSTTVSVNNIYPNGSLDLTRCLSQTIHDTDTSNNKNGIRIYNASSWNNSALFCNLTDGVLTPLVYLNIYPDGQDKACCNAYKIDSYNIDSENLVCNISRVYNYTALAYNYNILSVGEFDYNVLSSIHTIQQLTYNPVITGDTPLLHNGAYLVCNCVIPEDIDLTQINLIIYPTNREGYNGVSYWGGQTNADGNGGVWFNNFDLPSNYGLNTDLLEVVNSVKIDQNGIASGFTNDSYLKVKDELLATYGVVNNPNISWVVDFYKNNTDSSPHKILAGLKWLKIYRNGSQLSHYNFGTNSVDNITSISGKGRYRFRFKFTDPTHLTVEKYNFYVSTYTLITTIEDTSLLQAESIIIGNQENGEGQPYDNGIYLAHCYIQMNDNEEPIYLFNTKGD